MTHTLSGWVFAALCLLSVLVIASGLRAIMRAERHYWSSDREDR